MKPQIGELIGLIRQWGEDRNITGAHARATPQTQFMKLLEEIGEIDEGLDNQNVHEIIDGIGDSTVVLILLAELIGVRFEDCLLAAYNEIRERKGTMVDGQFVKE
jgi:NTP pyrophosphatase (non-canonical NTP hydrolase)